MKVITIGFMVEDHVDEDSFTEQLCVSLLEGCDLMPFIYDAEFAIVNIDLKGVELNVNLPEE